jgi:hypothetical protein
MFFSITLITIPTVILTFIYVEALYPYQYIPIISIMYYLYFFSTIALFVAGASDPGIFERNNVSCSYNLGFL